MPSPRSGNFRRSWCWDVIRQGRRMLRAAWGHAHCEVLHCSGLQVPRVQGQIRQWSHLVCSPIHYRHGVFVLPPWRWAQKLRFDKSTSLEEHSTWTFRTARNKSFATVIDIFSTGQTLFLYFVLKQTCLLFEFFSFQLLLLVILSPLHTHLFLFGEIFCVMESSHPPFLLFW